MASGSTARLAQLRLHIKEVSDRISQGSYAVEGKSHDYDLLQQYLRDLMAAEQSEAQAAGTTSGTRTCWTRGRASL